MASVLVSKWETSVTILISPLPRIEEPLIVLILVPDVSLSCFLESSVFSVWVVAYPTSFLRTLTFTFERAAWSKYPESLTIWDVLEGGTGIWFISFLKSSFVANESAVVWLIYVVDASVLVILSSRAELIFETSSSTYSFFTIVFQFLWNIYILD